MEERVKLYYQCNGNLPLWDFCGHAAWGARYNDVPAIPFEDVNSIPGSPYNIVVGSVEETSKWLRNNGFEVPSEIAITPDIPRASMHTDDLDMLIYPTFIKPQGVVKGFTGTVVTSPADAGYATIGYAGDIWVAPVVEFKSEWRCYISKGEILKVCHYKGKPLVFPDSGVIFENVRMKYRDFPYKSFTLDFGVTDSLQSLEGYDQTLLIEGNDAWAISNYGLESEVYYDFIKARWFQMTGLTP